MPINISGNCLNIEENTVKSVSSEAWKSGGQSESQKKLAKNVIRRISERTYFV